MYYSKKSALNTRLFYPARLLESSKVKFIHLYFGRNFNLKKSFRLCLTFTQNLRFVLKFKGFQILISFPENENAFYQHVNSSIQKMGSIWRSNGPWIWPIGEKPPGLWYLWWCLFKRTPWFGGQVCWISYSSQFLKTDILLCLFI